MWHAQVHRSSGTKPFSLVYSHHLEGTENLIEADTTLGYMTGPPEPIYALNRFHFQLPSSASGIDANRRTARDRYNCPFDRRVWCTLQLHLECLKFFKRSPSWIKESTRMENLPWTKLWTKTRRLFKVKAVTPDNVKEDEKGSYNSKSVDTVAMAPAKPDIKIEPTKIAKYWVLSSTWMKTERNETMTCQT